MREPLAAYTAAEHTATSTRCSISQPCQSVKHCHESKKKKKKIRGRGSAQTVAAEMRVGLQTIKNINTVHNLYSTFPNNLEPIEQCCLVSKWQASNGRASETILKHFHLQVWHTCNVCIYFVPGLGFSVQVPLSVQKFFGRRCSVPQQVAVNAQGKKYDHDCTCLHDALTGPQKKKKGGERGVLSLAANF